VFAGSPVSMKNLLHLGQQVRSKSFVEYDRDHGVKRHSGSISGMIVDKIDGVLETVSGIEFGNVTESIAADITSWGQKATAELESISTDITNWSSKAFKTATNQFGGKQVSSVE
jgi:hypothetical protein